MFPKFHSHIGFLVHERITLVGAMKDTWHIKTWQWNYILAFIVHIDLSQP